MPIRANPLAFFDFETTGKDPNECYPVEIAAQIFNPRSLELIPGAEFSSLCKPPDSVKIDPYIFQLTGITPEEVASASPIEVVYPKFVNWLLKYNTTQKKWNSLLPCGQNISFDLTIHKRMMDQYCKKINHDNVFWSREIDLMDISYLWFHNFPDVTGYSMDEMRRFFGIKTTGHRALQDVQDTSALVIRMLRFHRELSKVYIPKLENSFSTKKKKEAGFGVEPQLEA